VRVECKSIQDFLCNLKALSKEQVIEGIVRVSISERDERGDGPYFYINFQASALIQLADYEGQYLLEFGEDCGRDIRDSEPDFEGSGNAYALEAEVKAMCNEKGWRILPGIISI